MVTYANQKVVKISKAKTNKNNTYTNINIESLNKAIKELDYASFMLYMYMVKNMDGYKFALSCDDVINNTSLKRTTYFKAVNELISKGYLIQDSGNTYTFKDSNTEPVLIKEISLNHKKLDLKNMDYKDYLKTKHWINFRNKMYDKFEHKCQLCGRTNELRLHHNTYQNRGNEKETDVVLLCKSCHNIIHKKEEEGK